MIFIISDRKALYTWSTDLIDYILEGNKPKRLGTTASLNTVNPSI